MLLNHLILFLLILANGFSDCHFFIAKNSMVKGPGVVTLDQFGQLSCTNEDLQSTIKDKLKAIQILRLFPSSPEKSFEKTYLERKWEQFSGESVLHFAGFDQVRVSVAQEKMSETEIETKILNYLKQHLNLKEYQSIRFLQSPPNLTLPPEAQMVLDDQKMDRGYLNIEIHHEGRVLHRFFLRFKILESRVALVAKDNFSTNTTLNPSMFEVKEVEVESHIQLLGIKDLPKIHQFKSKRSLIKGEAVTLRQVTQMDAVKVREMIKGIFFKNGIRIEIPVQSLQRGKIGDFIQVIAPSTNKTFTGQILDERTVYIQF